MLLFSLINQFVIVFIRKLPLNMLSRVLMKLDISIVQYFSIVILRNRLRAHIIPYYLMTD